MSKTIECLKRLGNNVKKYKLIELDGKDEVTIGRNPDVTVCILSLMISRCHAILKKTGTGDWTIKDNKSLNGVFINDERLQPLKPYQLIDGDKVQFGVPTKPEEEAEFVFRYFKALKVKMVRKADDIVDGELKSKKMKQDPEAVPSCSSIQHNNNSSNTDTISRKKPSHHTSPLTAVSPSKSGGDSPYLQYKKKMDEQESAASAKLAEFEAKLKEMQQMLQEKESAQKAMAERLEEEKMKREDQSKMVKELKEKEKILKNELDKKQAELAREKAEMEERMREELDDLLQVKEASLLESLENQRKDLLSEKKSIEERLKKQLESEREKDKQLTEELELQKQKLEKVIEKKEVEKRLLESQLNASKAEKDKQHEEVLQAREKILSNFAELMETELQCSICNELFVKAVTLNCSHGFCWLCINQWMKVKKECPQCRAAISSHMRSIVLDSYIEKMVEQFSGDMKVKRQELVEERKREEEEFEKANKPPPPPARGRGRNGRARGRGGRGGRGGSARSAPQLPEPPMDLIIGDEVDGGLITSSSDISDDSMMVSDSSDNDSDTYSGDEFAFYGGYGRCFTCGNRGHWSNGCPFR